jgi:hypothetical protein
MTVLLPSKPRQISAISSGSGSTTTGDTTTLSSNDSGVFIADNTSAASISLKVNNNTSLFINDSNRIGVNITSPLTNRVVINDPLGDTIRLIYNKDNENKYADINVSASGSLLLKPNQGEYVNFVNHNNTYPNIKLNNEILYSNATQLNYNNITTPGTAEASKALILDSSKSIYGLNTVSMENLILQSSLNLDADTNNYVLTIENKQEKCLKLSNNGNYLLFDIKNDGRSTLYNNTNIIEILSDKNDSLIYPIHLTTGNNLNNTGIGIKFNSYNNSNIKKNISTIETIITNNQNNNENSIIKFNNMNNGNLTNTVTIRHDGYILCNTLMELSDKRTKTILNDSNTYDSLQKICNIKTYDYMYKDDNNNTIHRGLMAQELAEIIPSAVEIENTEKFEDLHVISNKELIGYLIDSIKELNKKINDLTN